MERPRRQLIKAWLAQSGGRVNRPLSPQITSLPLLLLLPEEEEEEEEEDGGRRAALFSKVKFIKGDGREAVKRGF